jgi:hypothetical protein
MKKYQLKLATEPEVIAPASLHKDRYQAGFAHALKGGQLDQIEYFKLSFREGFRAAKLYMRSLRRKEGIIEYPLRGRLKMKAL